MIPIKYRELLLLFKFNQKLTYQQLAEKIHTSKDVARDIISGRRAYVSLQTARAILEIAGEINPKPEA